MVFRYARITANRAIKGIEMDKGVFGVVVATVLLLGYGAYKSMQKDTSQDTAEYDEPLSQEVVLTPVVHKAPVAALVAGETQNTAKSSAVPSLHQDSSLYSLSSVVTEIGDYIDPDKPAPSKSDGTVVNIGDYIDPDADPGTYRLSDGIVREVGEPLDPDADPSTQVANQLSTEVIEIGEYIDPDEYFLSLGRTVEGEINLGEVIDPDDVLKKIDN